MRKKKYTYKIMLIWYNTRAREKYIFIHIPKNGGKYIRNKIKKNKENKVIKGYWGIKKNLDLAHIPYVKRGRYINEGDRYNYITYSRDPYDRLISGFFYKNKNKGVEDFKRFCKEELSKLKFNNKYKCEIIHYYPQYMFICNNKREIRNIRIKKLNEPKKYDMIKYYDDEMLKIVNEIYRRDFESLNYKIYNTIIEWMKSEQ